MKTSDGYCHDEVIILSSSNVERKRNRKYCLAIGENKYLRENISCIEKKRVSKIKNGSKSSSDRYRGNHAGPETAIVGKQTL